MKRLPIIFSLLLASCFPPVNAATEMPIALNLEKTAQEAQAKNIPIAILMGFNNLNSTRDLKEEAIYPNLLSGQGDIAFTQAGRGMA